MTGSLSPQLGDYRFSATRAAEVYILVDKKPEWREFEWQDRADYLYLRNGRTPCPYWVVRPVLGDGEMLVESIDRKTCEIVSIRS